jgi:hypothetical protein
MWFVHVWANAAWLAMDEGWSSVSSFEGLEAAECTALGLVCNNGSLTDSMFCPGVGDLVCCLNDVWELQGVQQWEVVGVCAAHVLYTCVCLRWCLSNLKSPYGLECSAACCLDAALMHAGCALLTGQLEVGLGC